MLSNKRLLVSAVIALVVGLAIGYGVGNSKGFTRGDATGYARAQEEVKRAEGLVAEKAAAEAAKAANPFQAVNPLQDVETNPFERAKKVLNPFE